MRLLVEHRSTYRFSQPQARLVQLLRLTPVSSHDQTVVRWRTDLDRDARLREARDGFGNRVTMLYVDGPLDGLGIVTSGEVLTSASGGVLHGVPERFPAALFARTTAATTADAALLDFARAAIDGKRGAAALTALNEAIARRIACDPARASAEVDAATAFAGPAASARDLAHIFTAAARALGVPARHVSGYCSAAGHGEARTTRHAWAEAYADGWRGLDPSTGEPIDERYVRVATALDASGARSVAGSRSGEGDEALDVNVTVGSA